MNTTKLSVLLVEDEETAVVPLKKVLEDEGYMVYCAGDGEEGLKMALEHHPDIILTDLKMPKMNGIDMIGNLRTDAWGKDAEVIILTNVSSPEMLEQAMDQNTFYYFNKGDSSMQTIIDKIHDRLAARGKIQK